ncbi:MAG: ethylbenzene dehydrogenase-related protein [Magnetococcus sp. YQC-5]
MRVFWHTVFFLLAPTLAAQAGSLITIQVHPLPVIPVVDGMLDEWGKEGWVEIPIKPALEDDSDNTTGQLTVQLKTGISGERIHIAARWPDAEADVDYRPWKWAGSQYKRGKQRDDMFVVRFDMGGDYAECMLSKTDYQVDLWQWSAGRSNQASVAEDFMHFISTSMVENAAEYEHPQGGMVYIRKIRDAGSPVYENLEAGKEKQGNQLPGIKMLEGGSGSLIDVSAKGVWKDGFWNLEMSRKLDTGHNDDVKLIGIKEIKGALAVFNKGYAEHKSVSETLKFVFP